MVDRLDLALRIISWGIIIFVISVLLLKALGVIKSPTLEVLLSGWISALTLEVVRQGRVISKVDVKLDMIWSDFKKRKKLK